MAQNKSQIQAILELASTSPRHRFGQNFMIDQNLVRLIAEAGNINSDDLVIEVGPGTGTLTEELIQRARHLVAVEIDRDLAASLRNRFAGDDRLFLIEGDALAGKHAINAELLGRIVTARQAGKSVKLVANLPYNIASPLVIELLIAGVDRLAFTVQKEVADRLRARHGTDAYGPLSVMAQMLAHVELARTLPPQAFWPMPRIESGLVIMDRQDKLGTDAAPFGTFVHAIFSFRRKTLRKAITQAGHDAERMLADTTISGQIRCEELAPEQFFELYHAAARQTPAG